LLGLCVTILFSSCLVFFFFTDPATTDIYTLSLHDALPISDRMEQRVVQVCRRRVGVAVDARTHLGEVVKVVGRARHQLLAGDVRSEEHTSELQSQSNLVCRLLLEKKNKKQKIKDDLKVPSI